MMMSAIGIYHALTRTLVLAFEIIDAHVRMKLISYIEAAFVLANDFSVPLGTSAYLILGNLIFNIVYMSKFLKLILPY